jgi:hypothetical protein
MLAQEKQLSIADLAGMLRNLPPSAPAAPPETRVVRAVFGNTALRPSLEETPIAPSAEEALLLRARREQHGRLRLVREDETGGE